MCATLLMAPNEKMKMRERERERQRQRQTTLNSYKVQLFTLLLTLSYGLFDFSAHTAVIVALKIYMLRSGQH